MTGFAKLAAFDSDSDSDSKETTGSRKPNVNIGLIQQRQIDRAHNAALTEDPTIFQYDELYDDIKNERETAKVAKKSEQKTVKYIGKLLESADRRKKEYERRIERQVQKERETEGEMYKDKEAFVTSSYKQKLEEMKQAEEEEKRAEYLESIGDVTKQRDLGGFYRHLYEQKMGTKPSADATKTEAVARPDIDERDDNSTKIKKTKDHTKKDRVYRKRKSSGNNASDDDDNEEETTVADISAKKAHLQSNLDADSDFSIDSDSDEEQNGTKSPDNIQHNPTDVPTKNESNQQTANVTATPPLKTEQEAKNEQGENEVAKVTENKVADVVVEESEPEKKEPKVDRKKIWEKRTVGDVLVGAIQRYFERKQLREGWTE